MNRGFIFNRFIPREKSNIYCLVVLWLFALIVGMFLAGSLAINEQLLEWNGLLEKPSLIFSFAATLIPVATVWLSLHYHCLIPVFPILFFNGVSRGFCGIFLFRVIGSGTWVIRGLYLTSGIGTSVLIWWLLLHSNSKPTIQRLLLSVALICLLDFWVISPFLSHLSFYF